MLDGLGLTRDQEAVYVALVDVSSATEAIEIVTTREGTARRWEQLRRSARGQVRCRHAPADRAAPGPRAARPARRRHAGIQAGIQAVRRGWL